MSPDVLINWTNQNFHLTSVRNSDYELYMLAVLEKKYNWSWMSFGSFSKAPKGLLYAVRLRFSKYLAREIFQVGLDGGTVSVRKENTNTRGL